MCEWEGSKEIVKATCMPFLNSDICRHDSAQRSRLKSPEMWILTCAHERDALNPFQTVNSGSVLNSSWMLPAVISAPGPGHSWVFSLLFNAHRGGGRAWQGCRGRRSHFPCLGSSAATGAWLSMQSSPGLCVHR